MSQADSFDLSDETQHQSCVSSHVTFASMNNIMWEAAAALAACHVLWMLCGTESNGCDI